MYWYENIIDKANKAQIKAFRSIILHDFDVGLLMRVCYPKRLYNPLSYFLADLLIAILKRFKRVEISP